QGSELLEALFLEDPLPVVVFDARSPEQVTMRLLTALWPSIRRQFAVSTFALSPRKVGGRDFNLVFAPKDARSKFSDWNGRRIDGRSSQDLRHRWSGTLVGRVFDAPYPRLLSSSDEDIVVGEGDASEHAAALRIALLWDELLMKLDSMPTAALGLLDIANSGKVRTNFALEALEPSLVRAIRSAPSILPQDDSWSFLGAIARKMHGRPVPRGIEAVGLAVADLARRAPEGAVAFLSQPDDRGIVKALLPVIAESIGDSFSSRAEQALLSAPPVVLGSLIGVSTQLACQVANDVPLIGRLGEILLQLDTSLCVAIGQKLLPFLVLDWQLPAARPLLKNLDAVQLVAEVQHLGVVNGFAAHDLATLCVEHAREVGARRMILAAVSVLPRSERRNDLLADALDPSVEDATWLLQDSGLSGDDLMRLLTVLLQRADDRQIEAILGDAQIGRDVVSLAERAASDLLQRVVFINSLSLDVFVRVVDRVFERASAADRVNIGMRALQRCLGQHFGGDEIAFISTMLGGVGERLDGAWVAQFGLAREIPASIASRNMAAFQNAPQSARYQMVSAIESMAQLLRDRRVFDLDEVAAYACAQLLIDAQTIVPDAALSAAGNLLSMLMWQRKDPVSPMIVAAFPMIYRELAKQNDVPDLLKFVPFFDWDRCKTARQELVSAFMSSSWPPGHLALTAYRCLDIARILRRTAKAYRGEAYLSRIAQDLVHVPDECREAVEETIAAIRAEGVSKYDWSD
ncbi:TPA: hypothetical protein ACK3SN_007043, partial [Burkholderia cepacia]